MNWDWLVSAAILGWLGLIAAAKMTHQTVPEMITGIKDSLQGKTEDVADNAMQVVEI